MAQPLAAAAAIRQAAIPERQAPAAVNRALPPDSPSPTNLGHQPQVHPARPIAQQPPRQPATLEELARQVDALVAKGDSRGATQLLQTLVPDVEKLFGAEHANTAKVLQLLGVLHYSQGQFAEAIPLIKRSLAIRETVLGREHPETATSLNIRALLLLLQNNSRDAAPLISRLVSTQAEWLRRELPLHPRALRMGLLQKQPEAVAASFALLDQDPAAAALALESRLNRLLPTLRIEPASTALVAAALNALAPQGLLVEFQKYRPWGRTSSGKADWGPPRYVALPLHPDGRIIAVPLGAAAPIDQAIEKALAASALVFNPLAPELRGVTTLFLSPDDATRAFMQAFYGRLLRGEGRADALAHTQAEFRNHPNPLYRDLYVWAAFQLTGDWRPISSGR